MTNDIPLKTFLLYCQSVETIYKHWKDYWLNYYLNTDTTTAKETKDLYDPSQYIDSWSENINKTFGVQWPK